VTSLGRCTVSPCKTTRRGPGGDGDRPARRQVRTNCAAAGRGERRTMLEMAPVTPGVMLDGEADVAADF
jgi:hypothetical protein